MQNSCLLSYHLLLLTTQIYKTDFQLTVFFSTAELVQKLNRKHHKLWQTVNEFCLTHMFWNDDWFICFNI